LFSHQLIGDALPSIRSTPDRPQRTGGGGNVLGAHGLLEANILVWEMLRVLRVLKHWQPMQVGIISQKFVLILSGEHVQLAG
jgi:hypothetical protein